MEEYKPDTLYTIGEVAALTGVSIRTLRHYHATGLLCPHSRSEAGYRLYSSDNLVTLWRMLLWRRLGFGLADIANLLHADDEVYAQALQLRRQELLTQREELDRQLGMVELCLATSTERMYHMTHAELQELFGNAKPFDYAAKVAERWGHTAAYRESEKRTRHYTPEAWRHIIGESAALGQQLATLMQQGVTATSDQAVEIAGQLHAHFERWYGPTPSDMFVDLAVLNATDPDLQACTDQEVAGLADYISAAARAWAAARH